MDETIRLQRQLRKAKRKIRNDSRQQLAARYLKHIDINALILLEEQGIKMVRVGPNEIHAQHV